LLQSSCKNVEHPAAAGHRGAAEARGQHQEDLRVPGHRGHQGSSLDFHILNAELNGIIPTFLKVFFATSVSLRTTRPTNILCLGPVSELRQNSALIEYSQIIYLFK